MKYILYFFPVVISTFFANGCLKHYECTGYDCVEPEAVVEIDSVSGDFIYTTLTSRDGERLIYPLILSSAIDESAFNKYISQGTPGNSATTDLSPLHLKVYYMAENQAYITGDFEYINAFSTQLEIVAFGDKLK